ncbi:MAG: ABC transporter ATP-binding protein, partial [Actinomyces sp.]|nr:ABC transporter ATP-binding protein [Actinomyces sp.]
AGKSTTIRILLGMQRADSGEARVLGMDPWADAVELHRRLAYVPGDVTLWPNLTGGEAIDLLTRLHRSTADRRRRAELLERFELDPTRRTHTYSKGNRQKVALVAALLTDAELYLFDEPTSGLDPLMMAVFTEEVRALRERGRTVLLSSHILGEVEALCHSVTIIRGGTDVESGTLADLRHLTRSSVDLTSDIDPDRLRRLPGVHHLTVDEDRVSFDVDNAALGAVVDVMATAHVRGLQVTPPSLEELFLRLYDSHTAAAAPDTSPSDRDGSLGGHPGAGTR